MSKRAPWGGRVVMHKRTLWARLRCRLMLGHYWNNTNPMYGPMVCIRCKKGRFDVL